MTEKKVIAVIPALNEEKTISKVIKGMKKYVDEIILVDDASIDETSIIAQKEGAIVISHKKNRGYDKSIDDGFALAAKRGAMIILTFDGDGQHPPSEIQKLVDAIKKGEEDLIIGSRFIGERSYASTPLRSIGIKLLAIFLSIICRSRVTDPASGFWIINRKLLYYFAHDYPTEYPEPEAIALMRRHGYSFCEEPVMFRPRTTGRSSIHIWGTFYYAVKVGLALLMDRIRPINPRFEKANVKDIL